MALVKKRPLGDVTSDLAPLSKKSRTIVVASSENKIGKYDEKAKIKRTSNLKAPTMLLEGHQSYLYTVRFSPDGINLASAGADKDIFIWHVYGECENHTLLKGHKGSILQLIWSPSSELIFSASTDHTAAIWDVENGVRLKKIKDHSSFVNSIACTKRGIQLLATGSDDGTSKLYDIRIKSYIRKFDCSYQVTAVELNHDGTKLFTGGIDNDIKVWDTRKSDVPLYKLKGHVETITSLHINYDNNYLLSNSMDNNMIIWDVQPLSNHGDHRIIKKLNGPQHGTEKLLIKSHWSYDNKYIVSGSSDRNVYIFDYNNNKLLYCLPGHKGSVNEVDYHPLEPIIVSCSSDKTVYLGELADSSIYEM